jgi:uncharacterized membrane protein
MKLYLKTVTYCAMHFIVAVTVTFALTRSWHAALAIGIIEPLVQTVFFNLHERAWARTERRRALQPAYARVSTEPPSPPSSSTA